ncbi:MAG: hypothetical protein ACRDLF_01770 [Solirubrobacteraceae bacterium]
MLLAGSSVAANASTTYDERGEWSYVVTCSCEFLTGGHSAPGTVIISSMSLASGDFSGKGNFANVAPATISGKVTESELSMVLELPYPGGGTATFTGEGSVEANGSEMSASGSWTSPGISGTGTYKAKRIRTYTEIEEEELKKKEKVEREAKERAEREAKEAQEAKEKQEAKEALEAKQAKEALEAKQAKEKSEKEAKAAQEAKEKTEKEKAEGEANARAAQAAKEAKEREEREKSSQAGQPAGLTGKTATVGGSGLLSLGLSNPNDYSISGEVTLTMASAGKASRGSAKGKAAILASASYTVPSHGTAAVKLKLSKSGLAVLRRHKALHVVVKVTTSASGQATTVKTYDITLKVSSHKHH